MTPTQEKAKSMDISLEKKVVISNIDDFYNLKELFTFAINQGIILEKLLITEEYYGSYRQMKIEKLVEKNEKELIAEITEKEQKENMRKKL